MDKARPSVRATLEIFPGTDGEPPVGALTTADAQRLPFSGWIELASAIEDCRHPHEQPPTTEATDRKTMT